MANGNGTRPVGNLNDYIRSHADADPKTLLELVIQENERIKEESRQVADVEIDANGQFKPKNLAGLWRLGQMYSQSGLVPDHYKNNPANCAIGCQMALRCKVDILTFLQSSHIIHGKPGIEAKLAIAMLNASKQIKGRVRFKLEGEGKNRQCTAFATDIDTGETLSQSVTWAMVEAEGWSKKAGSKWLTIPDLMFQYRSGMWLIRVFFPDVLMGMRSVDELEDMTAEAVETASPPIRTLDALADRLMGGNGNTAELEPAQTPGLARGEIPNDDPPGGVQEATQRPDTSEDVDEDLIGEARAAFNAAYEDGRLSLVGKAEEELRSRHTNEATRTAISGLADECRKKIKASPSLKGKQKELAGT